MNTALSELGRPVSDDPADTGVAEVIWATLRGVVLAQMSIGMTFDWQLERRALIELVSHYPHR
jgi:hypothetical protein